ncbi:MAG: TonB-dependent receptor [Endomicrobiales bacterium]|nr:TonB-dependent receptor [Endomicrobiales bacterium]
MSRKIINTILAVLVLQSAVCFAQAQEDEVFLSLTKRAESLKDLPTNVSIVTKEQIEQLNEYELGKILEQEAGLNPSERGTAGSSSSLMIRGSTAEQVLVLVDGIRVNDLSLGQANLASIPIDNIERIEIIRGSASAIYGASAFGGVVNIITKKAKEGMPVTNLGIYYGAFGTQQQKLDFSRKIKQTSIVLTGAKSYAEGWRENSEYEKLDIFGRLGYETRQFGIFDLSASYLDSDAGVPGSGPTLDNYDGVAEKQASTPNANQTEINKNVNLNHEYIWQDKTIKTTLYNTLNERRYTDNPSSFPSDSIYDSRIKGMELQVDVLQQLIVGAELWKEEFTSTDKLTETSIIVKSRTNSAGYIQYKYMYEKFKVIPSLRFDNNSVFGSVFAPRLSVIYKANDNIKLSVNSGKTWRAPTFNELYYNDMWNASDPKLKPEEGISSDIGIEYRQNKLKSGITLFLTESTNLISWPYDSTTMKYTAKSIGKSRQSGAEFSLKHKIISGLIHTLNYTYLWAVDTENNRVLNYRPYNTVNYTVTYMPFVTTRLNAAAKYVSQQDTWNSVTPQLPEYTVVDLSVSQKLGPSTELWVKANNVLDEKYQTRLGYPLPGVFYSFGANIRFLN